MRDIHRAEAGVSDGEYEEPTDFGWDWPKSDVMRAFQGIRLFNILPFEGGLFDQPADLMDAVFDTFFLFSNEGVRLKPEIDAALERRYKQGDTNAMPDLFD